MTAQFAPRVGAIAPFHVMELVARAKALEASGRHIVHLEVGEPDFPVAAPIAAAAQAFIARGQVRYTPTAGIPELRHAIAEHYRQRFGVDVAPERILVTAGGSAALQLVLAALVKPGERWLQPDPGYPCNRHFIRLFEGEPVLVPVDAQTNFQPDRALVERHWVANTRGIVIASPANPTGTLIDTSTLTEIIGLARQRGGHVVVDEIYQGLCYGGAPPTALGLSDEIFVVNSFSKYFGMTGWRLGWIVAPTDYVRAIEKLAQNLYICAPTISQHAALAAFSPEATAIFEARRREFARRRDVLAAGLQGLGFPLPAQPQGAFYIYAGLPERQRDSMRFAENLIERLGVAATPGIDFGVHGAHEHIRFAYTTGLAEIDEALARLARA